MRRRPLLTGGVSALLAGTIGTAAESAYASWQPAGLSGLIVQRLLSDATNPGVLYAWAHGVPASGIGKTALFKSLDAGRSWFSLERGLPAAFVPTACAVSPRDGRILFVAGGDGLYRSTNAGASWAAVPGRFPPITALHVSPHDPREVIAGTELTGNFRSSDSGVTWQPANLGLKRDRYGVTPGGIAFARHPSEPALLVMATNGFSGAYRSRDGGAHWNAGGGLPAGTVHSLAFVGDGGVALALHGRGLYRTSNAGETWQPVTGAPAGSDLTALHVDPERREHVYMATARGTLHRSTNSGSSWADLPALPRPARSLVTWAPTSLSALPSLGSAAAEGVHQLALRPTLPYSPEPAAASRQYFPETGHNVSATFLPFFRARGALDRFGPPRTEEQLEDGVLVQYFQKARLEFRPEFRNTAYEVQISLLGQQLAGMAPAVEPFESGADQRYFPETGHSVNYAFLRHYTARGGIDSFGYPVTEELQEGGRPVQYFQRARLEYRADLAGRTDEVSSGPIGDEILRQKGWLD
ncbi:MAG: WD40/YVTN/BNR-like repeat-containing protein [Chloroflexota bacterium]